MAPSSQVLEPPQNPGRFKHAENRRHKFTKPKYKVTNWPEYNDALRKRGDITIWFTEAAINEWGSLEI